MTIDECFVLLPVEKLDAVLSEWCTEVAYVECKKKTFRVNNPDHPVNLLGAFFAVWRTVFESLWS